MPAPRTSYAAQARQMEPLMPHLAARRWPGRHSSCSRNFGMNLHMPAAVQREYAQSGSLLFQGLTGPTLPCMVKVAAMPCCQAELLFRPLRLNGQVRTPICGLPAFSSHQALAEACRYPLAIRQASAHLFGSDPLVLHRAAFAAQSAGTESSSTEGKKRCGQRFFWRRCRCAGSWRPVAKPLANRSSMAVARARSAQRCSTVMWSPAPQLALRPTWSTASKTPANAETAAAVALIRRPAGAATDIAHAPRPGPSRMRRFAFRTTKEQGTAYV